MAKQLATTNWDRAYRDGKYDQEGPIPLVQDIIATVQQHSLADKVGFYPGCGNGRNLVPLCDAGLKLKAIDISSEAIKQLRQRLPTVDAEVGDLLTHTPDVTYPYLLSIQLFQHGDSKTVRRLFTAALRLLQPGGLLVLRVNSIHTQIVEQHDVVERSPSGSLTIQYHSGQKTGLHIHFYSAEEIRDLTKRQYNVVLPLREEFIPRQDGTYWVQWETILEKKRG